ncbi:unnamed protein product [Tenebrio molitor]|nr:unnamed protein product [Tenebrio molitor]
MRDLRRRPSGRRLPHRPGDVRRRLIRTPFGNGRRVKVQLIIYKRGTIWLALPPRRDYRLRSEIKIFTRKGQPRREGQRSSVNRDFLLASRNVHEGRVDLQVGRGIRGR